MKAIKRLPVVITALLLPASLAFAEPSYHDVLDTPAARSARPASCLLEGVALAGKRIVGVGQFGRIVHSDDEGKTWSQAAVPVSSDLLAVYFATSRKGWTVGHDGVVLHSSDGGSTWAKQLDGRAVAKTLAESYRGATGTLGETIAKFVEQGPDKPFLDAWFENENDGFIVGAFGLIFATSDGGKKWVPWYDRIDNPKGYHLYAIRPIGAELFVTSEQGTLFKLDRKARRFKAIKTPYKGTFFGVTGKPGGMVAFGMRGNAYLSRDGGGSWRKVETGVPMGLMAGAVAGDGKIVLVSAGGQVLVSRDDGASFAPAMTGPPTPAAGAAVWGDRLALVGPRGVQLQTIK